MLFLSIVYVNSGDINNNRSISWVYSDEFIVSKTFEETSQDLCLSWPELTTTLYLFQYQFAIRMESIGYGIQGILSIHSIQIKNRSDCL